MPLQGLNSSMQTSLVEPPLALLSWDTALIKAWGKAEMWD